MFDRDAIKPQLDQLAGSNILVGTSSWKYEGWIGQLYSAERYEYRGKIAKTRFEAGCLEEYAEVFPTVCVDAGFYRFPNQPRHGERAGKVNENFLNAPLFIDAFLGPISPYRDQVGVIMFEFSRFYPKDFEHGRDFVAALDGFLAQLPKEGWQYGVEMRNPGFLKPDYFQMLAGHAVTHVFNNWSQMPPVSEQIKLDGSFTTDFFAARFLLREGRSYQAAVDAFSPYKVIQDPNPEGRAAIKALTKRSPKRPSYIFVNNRFEGDALATIAAVLKEKAVSER